MNDLARVTSAVLFYVAVFIAPFFLFWGTPDIYDGLHKAAMEALHGNSYDCEKGGKP